MLRLKAQLEENGSTTTLEYDVDETGKILNFEPKERETELYGQAYLAYVNFKNRLKGVMMSVPTNVTVLHRICQQ